MVLTFVIDNLIPKHKQILIYWTSMLMYILAKKNWKKKTIVKRRLKIWNVCFSILKKSSIFAYSQVKKIELKVWIVSLSKITSLVLFFSLSLHKIRCHFSFPSYFFYWSSYGWVKVITYYLGGLTSYRGVVYPSDDSPTVMACRWLDILWRYIVMGKWSHIFPKVLTVLAKNSN